MLDGDQLFFEPLSIVELNRLLNGGDETFEDFFMQEGNLLSLDDGVSIRSCASAPVDHGCGLLEGVNLMDGISHDFLENFHMRYPLITEPDMPPI